MRRILALLYMLMILTGSYAGSIYEHTEDIISQPILADLSAMEHKSMLYHDRKDKTWYEGFWYSDIQLFYFCDAPHIRPDIEVDVNRDLRQGNGCMDQNVATQVLLKAVPAAGKKPGGKFTAKIIAVLDSAARGMSYNVVIGAVNAAADAHLSARLDSAVSDLLLKAGQSGAVSLAILRDTLLSAQAMHQYGELRDSLVGIGLSRDIRMDIEAAIGTESSMKMRKLIRGSIDETFSPESRAKLDSMITTFGTSSNKQITKLLDTLLTHVDSSLLYTTRNLGAQARDLGKKVDHTIWYMCGLAILGIIILILLIWLKRMHTDNTNYDKVTSALTYHIEHLPETMQDENFDLKKFKGQIQDYAESNQSEDFLHQQLVKREMAKPHRGHKKKGLFSIFHK